MICSSGACHSRPARLYSIARLIVNTRSGLGHRTRSPQRLSGDFRGTRGTPAQMWIVRGTATAAQSLASVVPSAAQGRGDGFGLRVAVTHSPFCYTAAKIRGTIQPRSTNFGRNRCLRALVSKDSRGGRSACWRMMATAASASANDVSIRLVRTEDWDSFIDLW